jgi:hypothetical protein
MLLSEVSNMQPDYMKMAQGQAAPQEQAVQISPEEAQEMAFDEGAFEAMGAPTGSSKEDIKQRFLMLLEQLDLMEMFKTPEAQQKLAQQIDALAEAALSGDAQAVEASPIYKLIEQAVKQSGMLDEGQPQAAPQQPAAPTNFAGMVKPPGGGMSGR